MGTAVSQVVFHIQRNFYNTGFALKRETNMLVTAGNKKYFGAKAGFCKI